MSRNLNARQTETTEAEAPTSSTVGEGGSVAAWIRRISAIPRLPHQKELELARRARRGDREAFTQLVQANLRLVVHVAKRHRHPNVPFADLIQEGNIGLMKAAERFDPDRGYRFSTYAVWWIRRSVLRALSSSARLIRLPESALSDSAQIRHAASKLRQKLDREATVEEIADMTGTSTERIELLRTSDQEIVSLDADPASRPARTDRDGLEDPTQDPEKWLERLAVQQIVDRALDQLAPRERQVLRARYGLDTGRSLTLNETGAKFHLSRERIRQIEVRALATLRESAPALLVEVQPERHARVS